MSNELVKLCIDAVKGEVTNFNYSPKQASDAIRKEFIEILGTDKPDYKTFRRHKVEIFEILEEVLDNLIIDGITQSDFFQQFVEYKDMNLGDRNEFYVEDRSLLTISRIADGHVDLRRQRLDIGTSFSLTTTTYGAKVYTDFLLFIAGRVDWAGLVSKIDQAMRLQLATDMYTAFVNSGNYLPAQFKASGTFSDAVLDDVISHIGATNGNRNVVIAGTRKALKKINGSFTGANSFLMSLKMADEINSGGILPQYQGIPLMEIPQVHMPNTFNFRLDDTKLFILPSNTKPIKIIREGTSIIDEYQAHADRSMEYTYTTKYGVGTVFNIAYGIYTVS